MPTRQNRHEYLSSETGAAAYDAEYYRTGCGDVPYEHNDYWQAFFGNLADTLISYLKPKTVFDAGCALGLLVESLRDRGVDAWGMDISEFAIQNVREDMRPYCRVGSLTQPLPSSTHYDLVTCIEVLEHLTPEEAGRAIRNLAAITDTILFSSVPNDFSEPTHINVRPPIDWMKSFGAAGFSPDLGFDNSVISPHAMLLRRNAPPLSPDAQVFYSDALLLSSAIILQDADVPEAAHIPPGRSLRKAFLKSLEMMRINVEVLRQRYETATQLAAFVDKNTEMGHVIDQLSAENQELRRRASRFEQRTRQIMSEIAGGGTASSEIASDTPPTAQEEKQLRILFDHDYYLGQYKDIREAGADPWTHFMENGAGEGRSPHPLFDSRYYLSRLPLVAASGQNPVLHYLRSGVAAGLNPHPLFDTVYYLDQQSDVAEAGLNPLIHFIEHGAAEGRDPHPAFNIENYLAANPDVGASGANPLIHYVTAGAAEGRSLHPEIVRDHVSYAARIASIEPDKQELQLQRAVSRQLLIQPLISIVVPVYRVPLTVLKAMVESVRTQTYSRWELCLAHGEPADTPARAWLRTVAQDDRRIKLDLLPENLGISGNSNRALALATGEFVGLLDHDDTLAPFALYEVAKLINEKPDVDFIYSDKDCTNEKGERLSPLFKPQWSPELMLSANYLTHFCVMRTGHIRAIGGWRTGTDGAQDWDLFFRVVERSKRVEFIDKVLYHWGIVQTSVASGGLKSKPYAVQGQLQTISERLARIGGKGRPALESNGAMRVLWEMPDRSVSIILSSDDPTERQLERARSLRDTIPHPVEVLVATPNLEDHRDGNVIHVNTPPGAPIVQRLNAAVKASSGWVLIFLDDGIKVPETDWVPELAGPLQLDNIGIVGVQVLEPVKRRVRHAGIVFNRDGAADYIFAGGSEHAYGVFGGPSWCRNYTAVAGGCFAIRRDVFDQADGWLLNPVYPRHDIDLCLRVTVRHGWRIFYNAFAQFYQIGPTRLEEWLPYSHVAPDQARRFLPLGDPYFHPRLESRDGRVLYAFGGEPRTAPIDYAAEARALTACFDFSEKAIAASRETVLTTPSTHTLERINWFLPEFTHAFYGGVHTILRAADYMRREHGVRSAFITPSPEPVLRAAIGSAFPDLARDSDMFEFTSDAQLASLPACDAAIATLWTTAYSVLRFEKARRKFYFMQDYESAFYPAGSISALVESTYHFGFSALCNTGSLRDIYKSIGGTAASFDPSINPSIFHAKTRTPRETATLFCYARPTHPRNCFELLSEALRRLKRRMGDSVRIVTAGADWSPRQYGLDGVVHNLGLLGYHSTGALYRTCTAGVALMMTRHPSYLPFELMACGALVVTNRNPANQWLLKDRENCLLAEPGPSALADALEEGLRDHDLRERLVANASRIIAEQYSDWDAQMEKIYRAITDAV
jgi:cellulose synthase/poly-beta-1,6-N-acetylglucosamine synthase-like glycosyltransferase/glycosyltransferase involved in cell wall biosynthesis